YRMDWSAVTDQMGEVGFRFESNWEEEQGSLRDCIFFSATDDDWGDIHEEDGARTNRLVLRPCQEGCGPCQITIKFTQRQCKVHSICVRSTAQVYELYSMTDLIGEREYVCTVHGEIAKESYDSNHRGENISKIQVFPLGSISSIREDGTWPIKILDHNEVDMQHLADILEKPKDQSPQNVFQKGIYTGTLPDQEKKIELPKRITKGEIHKSDEDSWVQVKSCSSLEIDCCCETSGASRLQIFNDKKHVEDTVNQNLGTSTNKDDSRIQVHTFHEPASIKNIYFDVQPREGNMGTVSVCGSFLTEEDWVVESVKNDISTVSLSAMNVRPERRLYKGTVEMVNAKPCISLTIWFPSVQDKCSVEVEEIRIHAHPAVRDEIKLKEFSNPFHNSLGGSLLAMLVPSVLESSEGGLSQGRDSFFVSPFHGSEESEFSECNCSEESESSLSECSSFSQSLINMPAFMVKPTASRGQYESYGGNSGERSSTELLLHENKLSYSVLVSGECPDECERSIGKSENSTPGKILHSNYDVEGLYGKTRHGGLHSVFPKSGGMERVNEQMAHKFMDPEVECSVECSTREVEYAKTTKTCMDDNEEYHGKMMQYLVEHVDRLEALCARIEVNLSMALDKMEKRVQLLESRHVLSDQSHINCSLGCYLSPSTSGIQKCQWKQESLLGVPYQPSSSSSTCLTCHEFNNKPSWLVNSIDCLPHPSCALLSVRESSETEITESSADVLNESTPVSLNHRGLSKKQEDYLPNSSRKDLHGMQCASEVITTGAGDSYTSVCEHTIATKKNLLFIDEAIASALAAFSASTHEEEIRKCTGVSCTAVGNMEEDIHYNDFLNFYSSKEVRFRTQEGMDSVPYGFSSQDSLDLRSNLNRGYKFEGNKAGNFINGRRVCKPYIDKSRNIQKANTSLESKTEPRLLKCRTNTTEKKNDVRNAWPNMAKSEPDHPKQYQSFDPCISSNQNIKDCNLTSKKVWGGIAHERTVCAPCSSGSQKPKHGLSSIKTILCSPKKEVSKDNIFIESNYAGAIHYDAMNEHISSSSPLDVLCGTYDTYPGRKFLESLVCNHTQQDGKTSGLQRCTKTKSSVNSSAPKSPHSLFFIEDEGL
ncbi:hypothetical protein KI387_013594, partial [Taxus chinensis]